MIHDGVDLMNATDSLVVIKKLIFEEKIWLRNDTKSSQKNFDNQTRIFRCS